MATATPKWLQAERRRELEDEMRAYVGAMAGTKDDLDPDLADAAIEHLSGAERVKRSRRRAPRPTS